MSSRMPISASLLTILSSVTVLRAHNLDSFAQYAEEKSGHSEVERMLSPGFGTRYSRGSIYTTIMELGPQNHNGDGLVGANSIIVVYMDPLGTPSSTDPDVASRISRVNSVLRRSSDIIWLSTAGWNGYIS